MEHSTHSTVSSEHVLPIYLAGRTSRNLKTGAHLMRIHDLPASASPRVLFERLNGRSTLRNRLFLKPCDSTSYATVFNVTHLLDSRIYPDRQTDLRTKPSPTVRQDPSLAGPPGLNVTTEHLHLYR